MSFKIELTVHFTPCPSKAVEAILWLASECPGIDVYHLVKAVYYAEKFHVSEYGRPVIGDEFRAATFGPLPQVVYGLLRHDPIEVLSASSNGRLPFRTESNFQIKIDREPNLRELSESDIEALHYGLSIVRDKSFNELYEMTHEDLAYQNARGGIMDYKDFLSEDDPERDEKVEDLAESARYAIM